MSNSSRGTYNAVKQQLSCTWNKAEHIFGTVLLLGDKGAVVEFPKNKGGYILSGQ